MITLQNMSGHDLGSIAYRRVPPPVRTSGKSGSPMLRGRGQGHPRRFVILGESTWACVRTRTLYHYLGLVEFLANKEWAWQVRF